MRAKIISCALLGEGATGKTTFAMTLTGQKVTKVLMTVAPTAHVLKFSNVVTIIWDFPGQKQFRLSVTRKLRSSEFHVALFFVDISSKSRFYETLRALTDWYKILPDDVKNKIVKVLVLNKVDVCSLEISNVLKNINDIGFLKSINPELIDFIKKCEDIIVMSAKEGYYLTNRGKESLIKLIEDLVFKLLNLGLYKIGHI